MLRRPVQVALLSRSCSVTEERLVTALEHLNQRGYLTIQEVRGKIRYAIAHEMYLHGIRSFLGEEAASRLQSELGKTLAADKRSDDPVRAYEVYELMDAAGDDLAAIPHGLTAMRFFAEAYAEPLAIRIGRRLLATLEPSSLEEERREVLSTLARVELESGQPQASKSHIKAHHQKVQNKSFYLTPSLL